MGSNALVEENHQSDNCNIVTKSVGSSIKIDSISIDLVSPNDKGNAAKCEHFSICGYVSEMRQKDWRKCWPFSLDHNPRQEIGSKVEVSWKIPSLSYVATEDVSNLMQKRHNPDGTAFRARCSGSGNFCEPACGQVEHADRNLNCMASIHVVETCSKGKETSADSQLTELMTACGTAEEDDETLNANKRHATRHPSVESEECDCTSSENVAIPIGNNLRDHHHDKAITLHRRKTRMVRLLTELLCEKGDADSNHFRKEESSSNAISDDADTLSAPQGMVTIQGNVQSTGANRKFPRDEGWRSTSTRFLDNTYKIVGVLKGDTETKNAIAGPELEKDLVSGMSLQSGTKSNVSKYRTGKTPIICKKRNGRTHFLDECQPLGPSRMEVPRKIQDETGVGYEGNVDADFSFKLAHSAFVGREMDLFPLPDQRAKGKSTSCEKKSKVHQSVDWKASLITWSTGMPKEGPSMRKDVQIMPTVPASVPFQSAQLPATDRGLDLASDVEGHHFGFSSNKASYGAPFCEEKHSHPYLVESGDLSLLQKKDFSNASNGKKNIKIHEHSSKKDTDRAENGSEQVAVDDVPMEIVELMAKNQYERCLPDAENDKIPIDLDDLTRTLQTRDFDKPCSSGAFSSFQGEEGHKQKPYAKNGRNGTITRCEIVGSAKQKSADNLYQADKNHLTMRQLGQTQTLIGSKAFLQHPEEQSSGFQYSAGSSSRQHVSENCKWIEDMVEKRPPNASCWQTFGPCNKSPGVPWQSKEGANIWPSILPNNSPFRYNVPQKHAVTSTDIDLLSHCPGTLHKGNPNGERDMNYFNQKAARVGKHKKNCGSKSIGRTHAENLFACRHGAMKLQHKMSGSLDLYANESIPAMHLLSLMDAGLQSSKPISMDVNPKFLKKPLMPHDSQPDFSGLESVVRSPSYDYYSKNKFPENSREPVPTFPTDGAPASLFQHDRSSKKAANFPGEGSWKSRENKKRKASTSYAQNKSCGPHKSLSTGGGFGTGSGSVPVCCKQKMFLGISDPMVFPSRFRGMQGSTKSMVEAPCATGTVRPVNRSSETEVCSTNRNPADFSLPEAGNLYTIGGEDLKFRAAVTHVNRSGLEKFDGRKRQPETPGMKQLVRHRA
ncbi:protein EMBRYONIC FLOWER 1-like isoform X2 [Tripterygium wilfordii]|uniref:protein EMBRYONIC FLOWER 1-like isoform X2 n=1 Tax=Tripterygium wilfordii TaxID=458696 RepID=UPI0018F82339|nr:protein EMBRYONIC FLOWER 1-like isoform X2 [Tripterygium wilfordii]